MPDAISEQTLVSENLIASDPESEARFEQIRKGALELINKIEEANKDNKLNPDDSPVIFHSKNMYSIRESNFTNIEP